MVSFRLLDLKGVYDFAAKSSVYKSGFVCGDVEGQVVHSLLTNTARFELEGPNWELGYNHDGRNLHAKRRWRVAKNTSFSMRQEVPNLNFSGVPSPALQLEHEVANVMGLDNNKLEVKYDTFWKQASVQEEAAFGGRFKLKASMDNTTKLDGAKVSLRGEFGRPWAHEATLSCCKARPVLLEYKLRPLRGVAVRARIDPLQRTVAADVEYVFARDGLRMAVERQVTDRGWAPPLLSIGFDV